MRCRGLTRVAVAPAPTFLLSQAKLLVAPELLFSKKDPSPSPPPPLRNVNRPVEVALRILEDVAVAIDARRCEAPDMARLLLLVAAADDDPLALLPVEDRIDRDDLLLLLDMSKLLFDLARVVLRI